jgi:hypothetical protein
LQWSSWNVCCNQLTCNWLLDIGFHLWGSINITVALAWINIMMR